MGVLSGGKAEPARTLTRAQPLSWTRPAFLLHQRGRT